MKKRSIAVIGGGAAALAFASFINTDKYDVTIYEKNKALGRKFLVAGKGGFNLTHSENKEDFLNRYSPHGFLDNAFLNFTNIDFRRWLESLGIKTFVGTSRRVFPEKGTKPIQVLKTIEKHIVAKGVHIRYEYTWDGEVLADIMVYALGGASWSVTGSDGIWKKHFNNIVPFLPANCAFQVEWPKDLRASIAGKPLKNITAQCNDERSVGEIMLTEFGVEGNVIYALSSSILSAIKQNGYATLTIDLKKDLSHKKIEQLLTSSRSKNLSTCLKEKIKLSKAAISLLKRYTSKDEFQHIATLAYKIKNLELILIAAAELDEAISTTGGLSVEDLDENFQIRSKSGHYAIGEMIDWNAPTGGYLLQACFSMGHYLAHHLNEEPL